MYNHADVRFRLKDENEPQHVRKWTDHMAKEVIQRPKASICIKIPLNAKSPKFDAAALSENRRRDGK